MKDRQGKNRGKCTSGGCSCTEYSKVQDLNSVKCEYCGHAPVKHIEMFTNELGACTNCTSCSSYESESSGSYSNCAYCECPAQYHKNADATYSMQVASTRVQSASSQAVYTTTMSMSRTMGAGTLESGPTGQLDIFQTPAPFKCKLPRCNNSCFKEVTGRVHDFCSKAHAIAYTQLQNQQVPSVMDSSKSTVPEASAKPTQGKLCSKCGQNPANPGRGWCQDCYIRSKQT